LRRTRSALLALLTIAVVAVAGCSSDSTTPSARLVKQANIDFPTSMAQRPGTDEFWVAERAGRVHRLVRDGDKMRDEGIALDVTKTVGSDPGLEGGFLNLTFSPDGSHLYANMTSLVSNGGGNRLVVEWAVKDGKVDESSRRELINLSNVTFVHMGGSLVFGPDGYLYVGFGDGAPFLDGRNTGQNPSDFFASILRIDPSKPSATKPYGIPADNPFVNGGGAPEVWMYGVRNPWRISFDRSTGDLWVGDVGDDEWEEVDYLPATNGKNAGRGDNLGWSIYEGAHRDKWRRKLPAPANAIPPIFEWSHKQGCAVIGGYVYRGKQIENLQGQYVFGDLCNGKVRRLKRNGKSVTVAKLVAAPKSVSFAQDSSGEIYVLTEKALFRLSPTS